MAFPTQMWSENQHRGAPTGSFGKLRPQDPVHTYGIRGCVLIRTLDNVQEKHFL